MSPNVPAVLAGRRTLIPDLCEGHVVRHGLIDRLNAVLSRKLALVSAHAGAGKTTLLASWARTCSCRVLWISLSADENNPEPFRDVVAVAAGLAAPSHGNPAKNHDGSGTVSTNALSSKLIEAADSLEGDSVLIFDNFQVIEAPAIHAAIGALIDHMPKHVHVVLGTRADPRLPLSRLRSQGQLIEIRGSELEFSLPETRDLLTTALASGVSHRDAELLHAKTQGWAAGLRLAVEAIANAHDRAVTIAEFGGAHPFVSDYIADEVLSGTLEDEQSFLIRTSIASSFCASLCEALTGSGQSMLRRLHRKNLFLVPLDEQARWYRYHRCFAEVLARRLEEEGAEQIRELHLRAMRWYLQRGMMRDVVHHALAAGEFQVAADAIEHQVNDLIWERGEIAGLLAWLAALPGEIMRSRPRLCLAHAWALALTGQLEALDDHLAIAQQSLLPVSLTRVSIPSLPVQQESASLDPPILGELAAVRAVAAGSQFDTVRLEASSSEVISHDPENRFLRSVLALSRARALDIAADIQEAILAYGEARALSESVGNSHVQIVASSRLAELWAVQGELHQSAAAHRSVLRMTEHAPERRSAIGAMSHVGLGSVLYEWNQLDDAARQFEEGTRQAMRWGHLETLKGAYFGLARVRFAQGATGDAFELLDEAEVLARHSNAPRSIVWVHAMQARLQVMQGNIAAAAHWYETSGLQPDLYPLRLYTGEYTTIVRLLAAQGQHDAALTLLEDLFQTAVHEHWTGLTIELLVLRGVILHVRGTFRSALPSLRKALSLAAPETYLRTFLDEGPAVAALLERAASQGGMPGYLNAVRDAFRFETSASGERAPTSGVLTMREREVLQHIAAGESNNEIAEQLILSLGTVKRHVSNIFDKLQVSSRTQAMVKARQMRLL